MKYLYLSQRLVYFHNRKRRYNELVTGFHRAEPEIFMNIRLGNLDYIVFKNKKQTTQHSTSKKAARQRLRKRRRNVTFNIKKTYTAPVTRRSKFKCSFKQIMIGEVSVLGEIEMPILPFLTGLWAGSICGTPQSYYIYSLWGNYASPRATGTLNHPWLDLPLGLTSGNCKHLLLKAGNFCSGG